MNALHEGLTWGSWSGGQETRDRMVEKRGAEPERLETRPGRTEKSPVARWPAPFPGPGSPKSPRRRPTDNRKEPRHHPPTLGTSLQRLIHRPGGPPGTPSPESSTSARGPSSAPARGPPLQRRLSEGAGRASPEPGPRGVGLRFERAIQTENPKTKPRGEFRNFPCRCELDSLNLRGRDLGWTVQARTAPRRSQEPGAEKEWGVRTKPGRAPANVLSSLAAPKPPARRPRG